MKLTERSSANLHIGEYWLRATLKTGIPPVRLTLTLTHDRSDDVFEACLAENEMPLAVRICCKKLENLYGLIREAEEDGRIVIGDDLSINVKLREADKLTKKKEISIRTYKKEEQPEEASLLPKKPEKKQGSDSQLRDLVASLQNRAFYRLVFFVLVLVGFAYFLGQLDH